MYKLTISLLIMLTALLVLAGCTEEEATIISDTFTIPVTFNNGDTGEYVFVGNEGKVGILIGSNADGETSNSPFIENQPNKYMWHFWGENEELIGNFKVIGIDEDGNELPVLVNGDKVVWEYLNTHTSPNNGADSHIPSTIVFNSKGIWTLNLYINEQLFDTIIVNVEPSV